jgi:nitrite reductase/ring-hydroxylating ferredoxin subunit
MAWPGDGQGEGWPFPVEGEAGIPSAAGRKGRVFLALFGGVLLVGLCALFALAVFGAPWTPRWLDTGVPPDRLSEGAPFPLTLSDRSGRLYPMILVRTGDRIRAFPMQPPGIPCLLKIEGTQLWAECAGCRFGADGRPIAGPCAAPLPSYPARVMSGSIWVDVNRVDVNRLP